MQCITLVFCNHREHGTTIRVESFSSDHPDCVPGCSLHMGAEESKLGTVFETDHDEPTWAKGSLHEKRPWWGGLIQEQRCRILNSIKVEQ